MKKLKPRIIKNTVRIGWVCIGGPFRVFGYTPSHSYERWLDRLIAA